MLPYINRLPRQEIRNILKSGVRMSGDGVVFAYRNTKRPPRFAFIISKKVDARASVRNRIRRVLSEHIRLKLPTVKLRDGVFVIKKIIVDPSVVDTFL